MKEWHRCYIVCSFPESGYSTDITPHNIYAVYFTRAVLEHAHPEWQIEWGTRKTSEFIVGTATDKTTKEGYFILVRSLTTDDEISPEPEKGRIEDAWAASL